MAARFEPFPSISNSYESWDLAADEIVRLGAVEWVVTEKIHGANFSFIITKDGTVACARRTAILGEKENFFQHREIKKEFDAKFVEIFRKLESAQPEIEQIQIFGEIYGGVYPHVDVPKTKGCKGVQQGIYYTPNIKFEIYDIRIFNGGDNFKFMDWDDFEKIADEFAIPRSGVLFRGTLEEAMKFGPRLPSTIFKKYGLPEIENNLAEGIVVRPVKEMTIKIRQEDERCILKKKIEEFRETIPVPESKIVLNPVENPEISAAKRMAAMRITENRLDAAISKVGAVTEKGNFKKILDNFTADVAKDLEDENVQEWKSLGGPDRKVADKFVLGECRALISKRIKKEKPT